MTRQVRLIVFALVALALATMGIRGIAVSREGLTRTFVVLDDTPIEFVVPAGPAGTPRPGVVVVHGFAGDRQLMYGIGQTLARNGYAAAIIDLPGHGWNRMRFGSVTQRMSGGFDTSLDTAVRWLRVQPGVDPARIALVGHSMGARAVTVYGSTHADIAATVAISGGGGATSAAAPNLPRNLLALAGAWEFPAVVRGGLAAVRALHPLAEPGHTYGDYSAGTARRFVLVPGVEHISVLFSETADDEIVGWLNAVFGAGAGQSVSHSKPIQSALLVLLAAAIGFVPFAALLFGLGAHAGAQAPSRAAMSTPVALMLLAAALLAATLVMRFVPSGWIPLLAGDYLAGFFSVCGVVTLTGLLALGRPVFDATQSPLALAWKAAALATYALVTFGITAQATWLNFVLVGDRRWLAVALFPLWLVYFLGDEALLAGRAGWSRVIWAVAGKLVTVGVLIGAVFVARAPFFLLLLVPALVPLLALHGFYAHVLHRYAPGPLPAAMMNAAMFAWMLAAVFPLT